MKADNLTQELFSTLVLAFFKSFPSTLKEKSFTKSGSKGLNFFIALKHPDIIEFLTLFHDFILKNLCKSLCLKRLFHNNHVSHILKIKNIGLFQILKSFTFKLRCIMSLFLRMGEDVFDNFLHENTIVTFGCHTTM